MRQQWEDWLANGEKEFTRSGRRKRASYEQVANWVVEAWQDIPREMIQNSFKKCGIVAGPDGVNDDDLHTNLKRLLETGEADDEVTDASDIDSTDESESTGSSDSGSNSDNDDHDDV